MKVSRENFQGYLGLVSYNTLFLKNLHGIKRCLEKLNYRSPKEESCSWIFFLGMYSLQVL